MVADHTAMLNLTRFRVHLARPCHHALTAGIALIGDLDGLNLTFYFSHCYYPRAAFGYATSTKGTTEVVCTPVAS